jgi:hypothetical protein
MYKKMAVISTILVLLALSLAFTTYAAITVSKSVTTTGTIVASPGLSLFSDSACTVPLTTLNWGSISPGGTVTKTVYIKNTGGTSMSLGLTASNWNPSSANGPLTISWNKNGAVLASGQSTAATISLAVSSTASGISTFSVQINISGTG